MPVFLKHKKNNISRRLKHKSYVAQLILILLGVEFLFLSAFTAFNLPTATAHNWQRYLTRELHKLYYHLPQEWQTKLQLQFPHSLASVITEDAKEVANLRYSLYVPQAPAAIFLGYVLGSAAGIDCLWIVYIACFSGPIDKNLSTDFK